MQPAPAECPAARPSARPATLPATLPAAPPGRRPPVPQSRAMPRPALHSPKRRRLCRLRSAVQRARVLSLHAGQERRRFGVNSLAKHAPPASA